VDEPKNKAEGVGVDEGRDGGEGGGLVASRHSSLRNCWSRRQECRLSKITQREVNPSRSMKDTKPRRQ
jgi:hypothetical protein